MNVVAVNSHIKPAPNTVHTQLAVSNTAGGYHLTPSNFGSAKYVVVQILSNTVRVTFDGTAPEATKGFSYPAGTIAEWSVQSAIAAKFIRESADAVVVYSGFCD